MLCGKFNGIVILQASLQQKMKFCIKNFFNKCNQIRSKLRIWSVTFTEKILNGKRHFFVQCLTFFTFIENIWQLGRIIKASIHHDTSGWLFCNSLRGQARGIRQMHRIWRPGFMTFPITLI